MSASNSDTEIKAHSEWSDSQHVRSLSPDSAAIAAEALKNNRPARSGVVDDDDEYDVYDANEGVHSPEASDEILELEASPYTEYYRRDSQREAEESAAWENIGHRNKESLKFGDDNYELSRTQGQKGPDSPNVDASETPSSIESHDAGQQDYSDGDSEELPAAIAWKEQREQSIRERDDEEKRLRAQLVEDAKKYLDRFYEEYARKKAKSRINNDAREAELLSEVEKSIHAIRLSESDGGEASLSTQPPARIADWDKVVRMIDLNPKGKGSRDVSRMRELILRMRNESLALREEQST